jgi:hypothetical protein
MGEGQKFNVAPGCRDKGTKGQRDKGRDFIEVASWTGRMQGGKVAQVFRLGRNSEM